jgi:uncharacterized protein (DUF486 family)
MEAQAIALLEYCPAVPANRLGYVRIGFAIIFLKEKLACNYLVAFAFPGVAAFFDFAFKAPEPGA